MTKVFISRFHFDQHVVDYLNRDTVYADKTRFPDHSCASETTADGHGSYCRHCGETLA